MESFTNYANAELQTEYTVNAVMLLINSTNTTNADVVEVQNLYAIWTTLPQRGRVYYEAAAAIAEPRGRIPRKKSPYVLFTYDYRDRVKEEYGPTLSFGELGYKLGEMWASLPQRGQLDY
jgi:hypothetical protein